MKNLKKLLAAGTLMSVLMIGATPANAGLLVSDLTNSDIPSRGCQDQQNNTTKVDNGILVTFTGILVTFTGILVTFNDESKADCGIIVTD